MAERNGAVRIIEAIRKLTKRGTDAGLSDRSFHRVLGLTGPDEQIWGDFSSGLSHHLLFSVRNRKDFFLSLLTSFHSYDEIVDEADAACDAPVPGTDGAHDPRFDEVWRLGKAFWLTRNGKYPERFAACVRTLDGRAEFQSPFLGEDIRTVSARTINLVTGYAFFSDTPVLQPDIWMLVTRRVAEHARHLTRLARTARSSPSDVSCAALGLLFAGLFFTNTEQGGRWRREALDTLIVVCTDLLRSEGASPAHRVADLETIGEVLTIVSALTFRRIVDVSHEIGEGLTAVLRQLLPVWKERPSSASTETRVLNIGERGGSGGESSFTAAAMFLASWQESPPPPFNEWALWVIGAEGFELSRPH